MLVGCFFLKFHKLSLQKYLFNIFSRMNVFRSNKEFSPRSICNYIQYRCVSFWILDTFRMKQTQLYVCTLVEFILINVASLLYKVEMRLHGKYTGLYTSIWINLRRHEITLRCHTINCSWIGCELLLAGIVIDERSSHLRWSFKSFCVNWSVHRHIVLEIICWLLEKLWIVVNTFRISKLLEIADIATLVCRNAQKSTVSVPE